MFDNVASLNLVKDPHGRDLATAMISCEKEIMEFRDVVFIEGRVEEWMNLVLAEMRRTNRYITKKAIFDYGTVKRPRLVKSFLWICLKAN